jgi:hypothetical protein
MQDITEINLNDNSKKSIITIACFRAFDMQHEKVYINKTEDEILSDLKDICSTFHLMYLNTYDSYLIENKIF